MSGPRLPFILPPAPGPGLGRFQPEQLDPDQAFSIRSRALVTGNVRSVAAGNFRSLGIINSSTPANPNPGLLVIERMFLASEQAGNELRIAGNSGGFPANLSGGGSKGLRDTRLNSDLSKLGDDVIVLQDDGALATNTPTNTQLIAQVGTPAAGWIPFAFGPFYIKPGFGLFVITSVIAKSLEWYVEGTMYDYSRRR